MLRQFIKEYKRAAFSLKDKTVDYFKRIKDMGEHPVDLYNKEPKVLLLDSKIHAYTLPQWVVYTDAVVGGYSKCELGYTNHETFLFFGELQIFQNYKYQMDTKFTNLKILPSFARVRHLYPLFCKDLSLYKGGIAMECKGDGRNYQFQMKLQDFDTFSFYYAEFPTVKGEWTTVELKWSDFHLNRYGRDFGKADRLDNQLDKIHAIGVGVEDYQVGPFELEFKSIYSLRSKEF